MRRHSTLVLALLVCTAIGASNRNASAQPLANSRYAQNKPQAMPRGSTEQLPPVQSAQGPVSTPTPANSGGYSDGSYGTDNYYSSRQANPFGGGCDCSGASCDTCSSCGSCEGCGTGCCGSEGGQWFATADYLAVRAHFSDALAFVTQVDTNTTPSTTTQHFNQIDFERESSFRVGGGYRLCGCGEEIVFNYTKLRSSGDDFAQAVPGTGTTILFPFDQQALNINTGQTGTVHASVDMNSYDLDCRKTIPFGGCCSSCGDACEGGNGCGGGCCKAACPAWDITWSGGIRAADGNWDRNYFLNDPQTPTLNTDTRVGLDFEGVGPRIGLEGRRYYGRDGWLSVFVKGNISLLWSDIKVTTRQETFIPAAENVTTEILKVQEIVPVTEMEAGVSAALTCHSTFSAGYLLSAWHDLGYRGEPVRANVALNTTYDDANILSFDGFFARMEFAY